MLFVHDQQAQSFELHVALENAVSPNHDVDLTRLESLDYAGLLFIVDKAREHLNDHWEPGQSVPKYVEVLLSENRRWRQEGNLLPAHGCLERRAQSELSLAKPDVSAQQAVHRAVGLHVGLYLCEGAELIRRLLIWKGRLELLLPRGVARKGYPWSSFTQRVDLEQLLRDVLDDLSCA